VLYNSADGGLQPGPQLAKIQQPSRGTESKGYTESLSLELKDVIKLSIKKTNVLILARASSGQRIFHRRSAAAEQRDGCRSVPGAGFPAHLARKPDVRAW